MNDMQQTLEDWADRLIALYGKRMNQVAQWTAREAVKARLQQAYEAGEIATKEKAAKMVETKFEIAYSGVALAGPCYGPFSVTQPVTITVGGTPIADAIRALPLSGAEESKK